MNLFLRSLGQLASIFHMALAVRCTTLMRENSAGKTDCTDGLFAGTAYFAVMDRCLATTTMHVLIAKTYDHLWVGLAPSVDATIVAK
jgi:hypothetical protein